MDPTIGGCCSACGYGCGWERIPNGGGTYLCCRHDDDHGREQCIVGFDDGSASDRTARMSCREREMDPRMEPGYFAQPSKYRYPYERGERGQSSPTTEERSHAMTWTQPTPEQANVKALLYGRSGMGKTRAAGTVNRDPKKVDTLVLNTEGNGYATIVSQLGYKPYVEHITSYDQALKVLEQLEKDPGPIKNVIVDSATELAVLVMDAIVGPRAPKIQDFGTLSKRLGILFRRLRDLPMNVVFTALVADIKKDDVVVGEQPGILGSAKELLPALVDCVFYLTSDGTQYIAQTKPAKGRVAKSRHALPIVVPTDDLWGHVMRAADLPGAPPAPVEASDDDKGTPEAKAEGATSETTTTTNKEAVSA